MDVPEINALLIVAAGWEIITEDLVFGSMQALIQEGEDSGGFVMVGGFEDLVVTPDSDDLQAVAEQNAALFAEYFFPTPGTREMAFADDGDVSGHPAHAVEWRVELESDQVVFSRFVAIGRPSSPAWIMFVYDERLAPERIAEGLGMIDLFQLR